MKTRMLFSFLLLPLLVSCFPSKPEIPMTEAPAGPLLRMLERQSQAFIALKAAARVQVERRGKKRSYESVAVLLKAREKFRIEAYGPLGQSLFAILWDGKEVLLRLPGEAGFLRSGESGFERLIGVSLEPGELCAILSGNAPPVAAGAETRAFCGPDNVCVVELRQEDGRWRFQLAPPQGSGDMRLLSSEVFAGGNLVYRTSFESLETISGYLFPKRIKVENPEKKVSLIVDYEDVEVNMPFSDSDFALPGAEGDGS